MASLNPMSLVEFSLRWLHLFFGMMWIGHLYYFNFTQGVFLNSTEVDNSAKAALRMKLLPVALWYFRWGAMWTFVTGLIYLLLKGAQGGADFMAGSYGNLIMVGAIFGITMFLNVWLIIWPKQQIVIANANKVAKGEAALPTAADAGARANVASRTNTLLSIPMLLFMGAASHLGLPVTAASHLGIFWIAFALIFVAIEYNAIAGKTYQVMTTVRQVTTSGFVLAFVLIGLFIAVL